MIDAKGRHITSNGPLFSQDEFINELTTFYKFLVRLKLSASVVKYPPPGGWPQIQSLLEDKDETVNELLRNLPYLEQLGEDSNAFEIYDSTAPIDYSGDIWDDYLNWVTTAIILDQNCHVMSSCLLNLEDPIRDLIFSLIQKGNIDVWPCIRRTVS